MSVNIFFCYANEDEMLLNRLKSHFRSLQHEGLIDQLYDRNILPGMDWMHETSKHLSEAEIILLLVSPDFMASDYCYRVELKQALERHQRKEAQVIPVILRPVSWKGVIGHLQGLPKNAVPVVSWHNLDEALYNVTEGVRKVIEELMPKALEKQKKGSSEKTVHAYEQLEAHSDSISVVSTNNNNYMLQAIKKSFEIMLERFDPLAASGMNKTIQWNIEGEEIRKFAVKIHEQTCELIVGGIEKPDAVLLMSDSDWLAIVEGNLDFINSYVTGRVRFLGNRMLAMQVAQLFLGQ